MSIEKHFTGHIYAGSAYETDGYCGNCDGAKCEICKPYWTVGNSRVRYYSAKEAMEVNNKTISDMEELVPHPDVREDDEVFINKHGDLVAEVYKYSESFKGYVTVKCNMYASTYHKRLKEALEAKRKWEECTCIDKGESGCQNDCCKVGCNNPICYSQMKRGARKERIW